MLLPTLPEPLSRSIPVCLTEGRCLSLSSSKLRVMLQGICRWQECQMHQPHFSGLKMLGKLQTTLFFFSLFMKCLLNYFFWLKRSPPLKLELFASGIFPPRPSGLFPIIVLASFLKGCLVCPDRGLCSLSFWIHCLVWIEVYYNKICCLFFFLKSLDILFISTRIQIELPHMWLFWRQDRLRPVHALLNWANSQILSCVFGRRQQKQIPKKCGRVPSISKFNRVTREWYDCFLEMSNPASFENCLEMTLISVLWGCVCVCVHARGWTLSLIWLFTTPWAVAHQVPLSVGFSRQEYWSRLPFPSPGDLPNPGIKPTSLSSPALAGWFFATNTNWEVSVFKSREFTVLMKCYKAFQGAEMTWCISFIEERLTLTALNPHFWTSIRVAQIPLLG